MRTICYDVYTIDEHPNKDKCFDWIRNNWHDLNQHSLDELLESLKALQQAIGGKLDYSISTVPDRGEFISLTDYDKEELHRIEADMCPLTGVFWDIEIIENLKKDQLNKVLDILHDDTEYQYSNEHLLDLCQANEYEFDENGKIA